MFSGKRLEYIRKQHGYSRLKLAQMIGVADPTIARWENDIFTPKQQNIKKLCEIFGVNEDYFEPAPMQEILSLNKKVPVIRLRDKSQEVAMYVNMPEALDIDLGVIADEEMEPEISKESIVFITKTNEIEAGEIYLVQTKDGLKLRRCQYSEGEYKYVPVNPKAKIYDDVERVVGIVNYALQKMRKK